MKRKRIASIVLGVFLTFALTSCEQIEFLNKTMRAHNVMEAFFAGNVKDNVVLEKKEKDGKEFYRVVSWFGEPSELVIPASHRGLPVTEIVSSAFNGCESLTKVTLSSSVQEIGWRAFAECVNLAEVVMPSGVKILQNSLFWGCENLKSLRLPDSVEQIHENAFWGCPLESLTVDESNPVYVSKDGCFIEREAKTLLYAFGDSILPTDGSVTIIGMGAFSGRAELTEIVIPDCVTEIGGSAFEGCRGLTSVKLPDGLSAIYGGLFQNCSSLESVVIPVGVTSIGMDAFDGCSMLQSVYYGGTYEQWDTVSIVKWGIWYGEESNRELDYSRIYYYSETAPDEEDHREYWRYVDGVPTVWET